MKRPLFRLLFVTIPLFIISLFMISACHDTKQEPQSSANQENHAQLPQNSDCVNEVASTLNQLGSIAAQGCPVNIK